eukprot:365347-Chlamydomonas_euryale.AAC.6
MLHSCMPSSARMSVCTCALLQIFKESDWRPGCETEVGTKWRSCTLHIACLLGRCELLSQGMRYDE